MKSSRIIRETRSENFEDHVLRSHFAATRDRIGTPAFWRALCPELTISDRPFARPAVPYPIASSIVDRCLKTLDEDGYFETEPLALPGVERLLAGTQRIVDAGFPTGFAVVFDEFWRLFDGLEPLLTPMLGDGYQLVPDGLWLFLVPLGHPGGAYHAFSAPHRDNLGPDPALMAGERAGVVSVWIALSDATPLNSCIYVLPAGSDEAYLSDSRDAPGEVQLRDIRALPAKAGTVMGWTTHLLHWGSRSSQYGGRPRASAALSAQRSDRPSFSRTPIERGSDLTFDQRLAFILKSLQWD